EGVDPARGSPRLLLAAARRACALVAAAAGACLADHGSILLRCSFGSLRRTTCVATASASVAAAAAAPAFADTLEVAIPTNVGTARVVQPRLHKRVVLQRGGQADSVGAAGLQASARSLDAAKH